MGLEALREVAQDAAVLMRLMIGVLQQMIILYYSFGRPHLGMWEYRFIRYA